MRQVEKYPVLSQEEEYMLGRKSLAGDVAARNRLVMHNQRYLISLVNEYARKCPSADFDDLLAEGNIGLIRAAQLYDPTKGVRFISYAKNWILQALSRYTYEMSGAVRLPQHQGENMRKIRQAVSDGLTDPTDVSLATGVCVEDVKTLMMHMSPVLSLDAPVCADDDTPLGDLVPDRSSEFSQNIERMVLTEILSRIPERHSDVLKRRYGVFGLPEETLQDLAREYGCTKERVRQIEKRALQECRDSA